MKGIVFNLLEEVVSAQYGPEVWDTLLDDARLDGAYTSLGSYVDTQMIALVMAASRRLGVGPQEVLRWFGRHAIALLADRYPNFFEGHASTRPFILTLNDIIHPEVRKLYPGADVPEFSFDTSSPDETRIEYRSARRLCALAFGMIEGAAEHFGEQAQIAESDCMHSGAAHCSFAVSFVRQAHAAA